MKNKLAWVVLGLAVFCSAAGAQVTSGTILGDVRDSSGAAIAGAKVTILEINKNTTHAYTTDEAGAYYAPFLIPGVYRVTVEKEGFKRGVSADIPLSVDQKARTDFTLEVGPVTESVEVTASAPLIRTESAELGEVVTERAIKDLPLNGRNFAQLVYLVPGVTPGQAGENLSGASTFNPRAASNFNALGSQANANAWLVDGIVDNEFTFNTVMVQPSVESIQEFKVLTGTFSAEFGRGAGVVSTQTKSGANDLHGSAFEFLRNNYFDARNYFNIAGKQVQPPYRRNQFGASVGGPIIKNKTFFFADYYGTREIKGQTFINTVPSALEKAGDFSDLVDSKGNPVVIYNPFSARKAGNTIVRDAFAGNKIPGNLINQVGLNVASLYPSPNLPGLYNNRVDVFNRNLNDNGGNIRVDHRIGNADSFFARYSYERFSLFDTRGQGGCCIPSTPESQQNFDLGPFVAGGQNTTLNASGLALNETHVFRPNLVNEFIAGYASTNPFTKQSDFGHHPADKLGIQGIHVTPYATGLPTINIPSFPGAPDYTSINGGPGFLPANPKQISIQFQDNMSWTKSSHQMKFGYRLVQNRPSPFTNTDTRSTLNFARNFTEDPVAKKGGNGLATLLLGYTTGGSRGYLQEPYYMRNWEHGAWFQDDWKVNRRFTLNMGLRWEVFTAETEIKNRLTNFDIANLKLVYADVDGVSKSAGKETHWKNFGPRIGFAYDVSGTGKMVVRGGFGISYFPEQPSGSNMIGQSIPWTISQNTPAIDPYPLDFSSVPLINNPFTTPTPLQPKTTAELIAANPRILGHSFRNETAYMESFGLNIERQIGESMVGEIAYAGSRGLHMTYCYNPQEVLPGPATVPTSQRITMPAIASLRNILQCDPRNMSNFHSLQGKLTKRFSNGVQFLASYTFGKSLDYGGSAASGGGASGGPQTITNFKAGYGPSGFDVKHRFVGSWVYELPFGKGRKMLTSGPVANLLGGWDLEGIATLSTGRPFSVSLSSGVTNGAPSWPDRIAGGKLGNPDRSKWFDPTAFAAPNTIRYGNVGRGVLYGPGTSTFDLSATKNFHITERIRSQLRVDAFNAFNTPQFGFPSSTINTSNPSASVTSITSTVSDNRDLQLALKFQF